MDSEKIRANVKINGDPIPFVLAPSDEPYFREAAKQINDKLAELQNKYGSLASSEMLLSTIAVEAMVDALQVHENYERLKEELSGRLEQIDERLSRN